MDYEQKYKGALERARMWKDKSGMPKDKQGILDDIFPELKESEDERTRKYLISFVKLNSGVNLPPEDAEQILAWLEKQGEQKPIDKVEPKFHEGDWVVQGCNILKIRCFDDKYYCFETVEGYIDHMLISEIDSLYHLWTIQDAKDGDVLARNNDILSICIFSHFDGINNKYSSFLCHCGLEGDGLGQMLSINGYHDDCKDYVSATKEQRDLLFQKMHEAGYEWDSEKKEPKKIEKKSAEWSEKDEERIEQICDDLKCGLENFRSGKNVKGLHFEEIIKSNIDWLKSLKDRVQPQPKQEWSEEDIRNIEDIDSILFYNKDLPEDTCVRLRNWLKSLKERIGG